MRRRYFHLLACWISVALFFLATTPGLAALLDPCHVHSDAPAASATLSGSCCSRASCDDGNDSCCFVRSAQFDTDHPRNQPYPFCPDCAGDCCICAVAKAPCVWAVVFPVSSASSWNQQWGETSIAYASPFRGILTPPPKG